MVVGEIYKVISSFYDKVNGGGMFTKGGKFEILSFDEEMGYLTYFNYDSDDDGYHVYIKDLDEFEENTILIKEVFSEEYLPKYYDKWCSLGFIDRKLNIEVKKMLAYHFEWSAQILIADEKLKDNRIYSSDVVAPLVFPIIHGLSMKVNLPMNQKVAPIILNDLNKFVNSEDALSLIHSGLSINKIDCEAELIAYFIDNYDIEKFNDDK